MADPNPNRDGVEIIRDANGVIDTITVTLPNNQLIIIWGVLTQDGGVRYPSLNYHYRDLTDGTVSS